jgi:hypothetical protein
MTELSNAPKIVQLGVRPPSPVRASDPHQAQYDPDASYSEEETLSIRKRQASRSIVTGALLFGLCVLFFGITLAKVGYWG